MNCRVSRRLAVVAATLITISAAAPVAQQARFAVAFYNIRSGQGIVGLAGHPKPFATTDNCDPARGPVAAWGAGIVQKELAAALRDDSILALGLAEAWKCGSPRNVRDVLGWKQHSEERNGTALVARYGFARDPDWVQLDTARNKNPKDTMWVVHGAVCRDAQCSGAIDVYAAHWSGTGPEGQATFDRQAQQTIEFMQRTARGPHVLIGDLNVWEGSGEACHQHPNNSSLQYLRRAGYVDAWPAIHGNAEGFTGMLNRAGCGRPEGAPWKRIDYAWSKGLAPRAIERFGVVPPGDAAPSDHLGIVASY
jgi:exonuclease III